MKKTTLILAVLGVALLPATAFADAFQFADSFAVGPGSSGSASITIHGSGGAYDPAGSVDVSGSGAFNSAVIDAQWDSPVSAALGPDLILWFGGITASQGALELTSVAVSEDGSTFSTQTFGSSISSSYANGSYLINFDDSMVPVSSRDQIVAARFTFTYLGSTTFNLDGVATVPEPTAFALFGLGLFGLGGAAVRRRRRSKTA